MAQSKNYNKVKHYYSMKLWDEDRVRNAVLKKWITETEFKKITGKDYK